MRKASSAGDPSCGGCRQLGVSYGLPSSLVRLRCSISLGTAWRSKFHNQRAHQTRSSRRKQRQVLRLGQCEPPAPLDCEATIPLSFKGLLLPKAIVWSISNVGNWALPDQQPDPDHDEQDRQEESDEAAKPSPFLVGYLNSALPNCLKDELRDPDHQSTLPQSSHVRN